MDYNEVNDFIYHTYNKINHIESSFLELMQSLDLFGIDMADLQEVKQFIDSSDEITKSRYETEVAKVKQMIDRVQTKKTKKSQRTLTNKVITFDV